MHKDIFTELDHVLMLAVTSAKDSFDVSSEELVLSVKRTHGFSRLRSLINDMKPPTKPYTHCRNGHKRHAKNTRFVIRNLPDGRTRQYRVCTVCVSEGNQRRKARGGFKRCNRPRKEVSSEVTVA